MTSEYPRRSRLAPSPSTESEPSRTGGARLASAAGAIVSRRNLVRLVVSVAAVVLLVRPLVPRIGNAAHELGRLDPSLTAVGFLLQVASLLCYSRMTQIALGEEHDGIGLIGLFRFQLVSRAVSSTVPAGAAAGPAIGFRLLTSSGLSATAVGASLASVSVLSALVLNLLLWTALVVSIPAHGLHTISAVTALIGIMLVLSAAVIVSVVDGSELVARFVPPVARRFGADGDRLSQSIRRSGEQIGALVQHRRRVGRLMAWAAANWLLDALSLWVFLHMFGATIDPIGVVVAFGVANVLAAVPITPGGVGIVEWAYLSILVGFGAGLDQAMIAVTGYRIAQFLFPVGLGALSYSSLVVESTIKRRQRLACR